MFVEIVDGRKSGDIFNQHVNLINIKQNKQVMHPTQENGLAWASYMERLIINNSAFDLID